MRTMEQCRRQLLQAHGTYQEQERLKLQLAQVFSRDWDKLYIYIYIYIYIFVITGVLKVVTWSPHKRIHDYIVSQKSEIKPLSGTPERFFMKPLTLNSPFKIQTTEAQAHLPAPPQSHKGTGGPSAKCRCVGRAT